MRRSTVLLSALVAPIAPPTLSARATGGEERFHGIHPLPRVPTEVANVHIHRARAAALRPCQAPRR